MAKISKERFILKLGNLMETVALPASIESEGDFEYAVLPYIKKFIEEELTGSKMFDGVLYYHGRNTEEKKWWSKSKPLQTVKLFGTNVSDIFIVHEKIGAVALELKYVKLSKKGEGLTGSIQRAIGQSLIATMRHPFAICVIVYRQEKKHLEIGIAKQLKDLLWEHHRIYLVIRKQAIS